MINPRKNKLTVTKVIIERIMPQFSKMGSWVSADALKMIREAKKGVKITTINVFIIILPYGWRGDIK